MKRLIAVMAMATLLGACGKASGPKTGASGDKSQLSGAGATFPAPLYTAWASGYETADGARVNYQAIGSGGGIKQIKDATVDFGGTDKPLEAAELAASGLEQFPTVLGGVVPVVNAPGIGPGQVRLDGPLLADVFLGKVKKWNDARIAALNPGVSLPNLPITVVHRSDGSGTSFLFTTYLAGVSGEWKAQVGASDSVQWPTGLGGKGNDGVAAFVRQTSGSIGYVEYAYAKQNKLAHLLLKNRSGAFVAPDADGFAAAAAGADWAKAPGFYLLLLDQPGAKSWPITGATFILTRQDAAPEKVAAVHKFFGWAYDQGDADAARLDYVPLPASVKALVRASWAAPSQ